MKCIVEKLRVQHYRNSTKQNYYCVWHTFNEFFIKLDVKPPSWEERLILFVAYLADQKQRKSTTIRSYISAIKSVLLDDGVVLNENKYLLTSLTKACKLRNDKVTTRLPIQKGTLNLIVKNLHHIFSGQPFLEALYKALFSTAYFGLFRVGELTSGSHPILAKDVHIGINKNKMLFVLHSSKTHGKDSKPQIVMITQEALSKSSFQNLFYPRVQPVSRYASLQFCPYELLHEYLAWHGGFTSLTEPFFIFRDRTPVSPNNMRKMNFAIFRVTK